MAVTDGCGVDYSTRHGDGRIDHKWRWSLYKDYGPIAGTSKVLVLPKFSLSEADVHRFRVTDLPKPTCPTHLVVKATWEEQFAQQWKGSPWREALVEVVILDENGGVMLERWFDLGELEPEWRSRWRRAPVRPEAKKPTEARFRLFDLGEPLDTLGATEFEVIVSVDRPAARPGEVAYLVGPVPREPPPEWQQRLDRQTIANQGGPAWGAIR
jgi:hypothetical protein